MPWLNLSPTQLLQSSPIHVQGAWVEGSLALKSHVSYSLIPSPILCFILQFVLKIIHEVEEQWKKGRPGRINCVNDVWWTWGGHRGTVPIVNSTGPGSVRRPVDQVWALHCKFNAGRSRQLQSTMFKLICGCPPPLPPPHYKFHMVHHFMWCWNGEHKLELSTYISELIWSHYGNTIDYMHVGRCLLVYSWFDPIPCWVLSWVPI